MKNDDLEKPEEEFEEEEEQKFTHDGWDVFATFILVVGTLIGTILTFFR